MAYINIPSILTPYTNDQHRVALSANTVGLFFEKFFANYPKIESIIQKNGRITPFITLYLNKNCITTLADTPLADTDELSLIPAISGG